MSEHTKGPWTFVFYSWNSEHDGIAGHSAGSIVADYDSGRPWYIATMENCPEQQANARLIAAAPELLCWASRLMAELKMARDANPEAFAEFVDEVCSAGFPGACIAMAQAIAKTEGK